MINKRIVLIQPETRAGASLGIRKAPSSIQHLAGQLKQEGFDVSMKHTPVSEELVRGIKESGAKIVGISTMTSNFREGEELAKMLKVADPSMTTILGGWHASGCAMAYSRGQEAESITEILGPKTPFDYMVAGEGELALPELLRRLSISGVNCGAGLDGVPGLGRYANGQIILSPPAKLASLDSVADPIWDGLDISSYRDMRSGALDLSIHFQRGCPWGCGFCATPTVSGRTLRSLSIDRVIFQLTYLAETFKPQVITFTNEDPLVDLDYFRALIGKLNEIGFCQKYGLTIDIFASVVDIYRIMTNPKYEGMMDEMKKAGISSFTIGVESFNPSVLRMYNKIPMIRTLLTPKQRERFGQLCMEGQDSSIPFLYSERIRSAVAYAYKHGIPCVGDYMIGNPGESEADVRKGFELFSKIPGLLIAYIPQFTPFPGTKVWAQCYPKIVRGADGRIPWEKFDASHGSVLSGMKDGLRDELELAFYTSERYIADMRKAIADGFLPVQFFLGRFSYMVKTFADRPLVEKAKDILHTLEAMLH